MRTAVILFNLGGPNDQAAVRPFLYNLFSDPSIIRVPNPLRWLIARSISRKRAPVAQEIYKQMGGGSPILPNTEAQARALEAELGEGYKCFIAMRYWHPRMDAVRQQIQAYKPHHVVMLPLYPQFSSTTTLSSFKDYWKSLPHIDEEWDLENDPEPFTDGAVEQTVCCYPVLPGFITALADLISPRLIEAASYGVPRLLLSAHGLPEKIIKKGDPYQWQCEQTTQALLEELKQRGHRNIDSVNCYQSRVGPLKWIGPSTDEEVERAAAEGKPIVMVPLAFVSEHSETLVELDIEYRELATHKGAPFYSRVPTVSTHPAFISGLAGLVRTALVRDNKTVAPAEGQRLCPPSFKDCPCRAR